MRILVTGPNGHPTVRSVLRSAVTHGAVLAILATGLTFVASTSASAVPTTRLADPTLHTGVGAHTTTNAPAGAAQSPTNVATNVGLSPLVAQSALTLTSTSGVAGTALTLTSSGGSGTGAVTYGVTSTGTAGCFITSDKLNATRAGTCTVSVTKAADSTYPAASSPATTVTFAPAALKVQSGLTLTSTSGVVGATLTLASSGGSGTGALTYGVTGTGTAGCWIANGGLNATRSGTCTVRVTKAGDPTYQVARSSATTVVFQVKVVPVKLTANRVNGFVWVGRTSIVTITGTGFYGKPTIRSNQARTTAVVIHDYGRALVVRVTLAPRSAQGWHVFTITLANGHSTRVRYLVKVGLTANRVNGFVWVGRTSIVTITGTGFYGKPTIRSNQARTTAVVIHDYGRALVVRVTLAPRSAQGWHVFTVTLANGHSCKVRYLVK